MSVTHFKSHIVAEGGISGPGILVPWAGTTFYVDGANGSDSYCGKSPLRAFLTLTAALAACTNWLHDVIIVRNYGLQATETYPIVINKKVVTIIGQVSGSNLPQIEPDTDKAGIEFEDNSGAGTRFFNIGFKSGASFANVLMSGTIFAVQFHNCCFGMQGDGGKNGFRIESDSPDLVINDCLFDDSIAQHHIHILGSSTRGLIQNCRFHGINETFSGITDVGGTGFLLHAILNNYFFSVAAKKAFAINHTGLAGSAFIDGNKANYGGQAPFIEKGTNFWCVNYKGDDLTLPASS